MQKIDLVIGSTDQLVELKRKIFSNENQDHIRLANKANTIEEDQYENEQNLLSKSALLTKRPILSNYDSKQNSLIFRKSQRESEQLDNFSNSSNNNNIQIKFSQGLNFQWQKSGFRIITLIARFIYQLKIKTDKLKIKMITTRIFNFIGDFSSDFQEFCGISKQPCNSININQISLDSFFQRCLQRIKLGIDNYIPVIQPESTFKIILDSVVVLFIVINIFYIPMSLSFGIDKSNQTTQLIFETIPSYIFIIEILLNFNTAYYKHGLIHTQRKDIFKNYLQGSFCWDLMIAIPFILAQFDIPFIQFILLLRVTRVRSMIQNVEDLLNVKESVQVVMELIKLIYFIVFVTHMCCCAWHLLGQIEADIYDNQKSWLIYYDVYDSSWQDRYIISMYWCVITTLTVGYGDIVPQTSMERIFVIFVAMIICGSFGYTISTIGQIMETLGQKQKEFKKQMRKKNLYIKEKKLNFQLSLKVRKYFEYQIQLQQKQNKMDEELISGLNDSLKHEVRIDIYKKILLTSKIIKNNFSNDIIDNLCQKVKQINYAPGDEIIQVDSQSNQLLFVVDGSINIFSKGLEGYHSKNDNNGKFFNQCGTGTVIGEQEFIMQSQHKYSYKAEQFTQIIYLEKQDFIEVLKKDEESYIKFIELKDKLIYSQKYVSVCQICNWTHHYLNCPFAFYQPNKWKILEEQRKSIPQNRLYYQERSKLAKFQTKSNQHLVLEKCVNFMFDNGYLTDEQLTEVMLSKLGMEFSQENLNRQVSIDSSQNSNPQTQTLRQSQLLIKQRKSSQIRGRESIYLKPLKNPQVPTKQNLPLIINDEDSVVNPSRNSQLNAKTQFQSISKENNIENFLQTQTDNLESVPEIKVMENIQEAMDIDLAQTFTNYYPNFNLANVIESFNKQSLATPQQKATRSIMQEKLNKLKLKSQKVILGQVSRSKDSKLSYIQDE